MGENETSAIIGLRGEIKQVRARARELTAQNKRWRDVAQSLRKLAGIDEQKFRNLLRAESLPVD